MDVRGDFLHITPQHSNSTEGEGAGSTLQSLIDNVIAHYMRLTTSHPHVAVAIIPLLDAFIDSSGSGGSSNTSDIGTQRGFQVEESSGEITIRISLTNFANVSFSPTSKAREYGSVTIKIQIDTFPGRALSPSPEASMFPSEPFVGNGTGGNVNMAGEPMDVDSCGEQSQQVCHNGGSTSPLSSIVEAAPKHVVSEVGPGDEGMLVDGADDTCANHGQPSDSTFRNGTLYIPNTIIASGPRQHVEVPTNWTNQPVLRAPPSYNIHGGGKAQNESIQTSSTRAVPSLYQEGTKPQPW